METKPVLKIGNIPIFGDLILAPMDGITDSPFRGLCRRLGSAMSVTEFINALDVLQDNQRYTSRIVFAPSQRPLSLQLLGDQPERILEAALQLVHKVQPDIIDINLGCQSKNVTSRAAGAGLMKTPKVIASLFRLMTRQFNVPISGKIRLGWDEKHLNYLEIAKIIQDNGGAMITVHGRTSKQAYQGKARWEPIQEVKQALQIPVVGNGDVRTVEDIRQIKKRTGCDAVMIGRAAVGNPWIFSRMDRNEVPIPMVQKTVLSHLEKMLDFYGDRGVITFRKYLKAYLAPYDLPREDILPLLKNKDPNTVKKLLTAVFEKINEGDNNS